MPKMNKEVVVEEEAVSETRDLATRKCDSYGNYEIYREGGGVVPDLLKGIYTTPTKAQTVLDHYYEILGFENEAKKIKNEMKSIHPLDHTTYDDDHA